MRLFCLTCVWFVVQISVFNELKQALSPILWLFVECGKHTKVSAGSDDNVKIALIMGLYFPMNYLKVISTFCCPRYWIPFLKEANLFNL